ncbi:MAG: hypothetical protein AAF436_10645 [Myxococcota bacterium]
MRLIDSRVAIFLGSLLASVGCGDGSSANPPSEQCVEACVRIEAACGSTTPDCASDCQDDLDRCPTEMGALLECVDANTIECDADQDQGLAEAPCEDDHAALGECGADAF